jgi:hypothetical protein
MDVDVVERGVGGGDEAEAARVGFEHARDEAAVPRQGKETALEADHVAGAYEILEIFSGDGVFGAREAETREDRAAPERSAVLGAKQLDDSLFELDDGASSS